MTDILPTPEFREPPAAPAALGPPPAEPEFEFCFEARGQTEEEHWLEILADPRFCQAWATDLRRHLRSPRPAVPDDWGMLLVLLVREFPATIGPLGLTEAEVQEAAKRRYDPRRVAVARGLPPDALEVNEETGGVREKGPRDEWAGYLHISTTERDQYLAAWRVPFVVHGVRLRTLPKGTVWELLIRRCPLGIWGVLRIPCGNAQRDRQCRYLQEHAPWDQALCLYHQRTGQHSRLAFDRAEWWDAPEAWAHLPPKARRWLEAVKDVPR